MYAWHVPGGAHPDWSMRMPLTYLQQFEYLIKDGVHEWEEGHTMERETAMGKGILGVVPSTTEGLRLTWCS